MSATALAMNDTLPAAKSLTEFRKADGEAYGFSSSLVTIADPSGPDAEAIRGLRTHITVQHLNLGRRAFTVCGPSEGVGTSFVAANLAVALAQTGVKTVLVDGNLRKPGLNAYIRPPSTPIGMSAGLSDPTIPFDNFFDAHVLTDLSVIYAGTPSANAQELLATDRFKAIMDFCMREFDATIVDTPPANRSYDAKQISAIVGYSLIVTRKAKTFFRDVKTLAGQLNSDGVRIIGTVLCGA